MSHRYLHRTLIVTCCGLAACGGTAGPTPTDPAFTEAAVIGAIESYHAAWEALDFDGIAGWHTDDLEYVFFMEIVPADAFPRILSEQWMADAVEFAIDESDFRVTLIAPDHAHVTVTVEDDTSYADGTKARTDAVMSYLLQLDENWKVRRIHHSGPPPADLYEGVTDR
jgi:ketosteroid isomerase-like protein